MIHLCRAGLLLALTLCLTTGRGQPISPLLFGQNHWLADGDERRPGYLHLLWPQVEASGVKIVRVGGNAYNRRFPARARLDQIVDSIQGIGAEVLLQVPMAYTDRQAQELVEYYTSGTHARIDYWCIGNEPLLHDRHTIEEVHAYLLRLAKAMREVAPDIKIFVFDEAYLHEAAYAAFLGGDMDLAGLRHNGVWLIDGITFHNYPNGETFTRDDVIFYGPQKVLGMITTLDSLMDAANNKYGRTGADRLLWGLSEFHVTYVNPNREISGYGNPSFLAGQFFAEIFGFGMAYEAHFMAPWCISEVDRIRTDFGYLGLHSEFMPRSTYYHMQMMSRYLQGTYLPSEDNQPYVKTVATQGEAGIALMLMNQHVSETFAFKLGAKGRSPLMVSIANLPNSLTYEGELPPQTTLLLRFSPEGRLTTRITYSLRHNLAYEAPTEESF